MPLFARAFAMHYPDRERSPRLDHHIVLCGSLEVGGFYRIGSGPSEGRWSWGATLGSGNADFIAGGNASHGDVCRTLIALAFRRMLARAELRERAHAKPGPPRRGSPEASIEPSEPSRHDDRDADHRLGPMIRDELSRVVRSGELDVGVLSRAARGDERWSWSLTGLHRPDDGDFIWRGENRHRTGSVRGIRAVLVAVARVGRAGTGRRIAARPEAMSQSPTASACCIQS